MTVSLHPRMTIVNTSPAERKALVEALTDVLAARETPLSGTVESGGDRMELVPELVARLGIDVDTATSLIVTALDLDGDDGEPGDRLHAARRRAARAVERLTVAKAAHARATLPLAVHKTLHTGAAPQPATLTDAALADLRERASAIGAAVVQADQDRRRVLDESLRRRDEVARLEAELVDLREAITRVRDEVALTQSQAESRYALEGQLRQLERTLTGLRAASSHALVQQERAQRAALAAELGHCQSKKAEIEALKAQLGAECDELPTADPGPLQAALAEALAAHGVTEADPVARALLDEWRTGKDRLSVVYDRVGRHSNLLRKARARYETAAQLFDKARQGRQRTSSPDLGAAERQRIEAAHEAVQEAQERAGKRMAGLGARRQLDMAIEAEGEVLAEFGFVSYAEYLMSGSLRVLEQHASRESVELEQEFQRARASLTALESYTVPEDDMAAAEAAQREIQQRIAAYLGADPGDNVEERLTAASTVSPVSIVTLKEVAAGYGLQAPDADIVAVAENWLADRGRADERRETILRQLATLEVDERQVEADIERLASVVYEPMETPPTPAPTPEEHALDGRIAELRIRLATLDDTESAPGMQPSDVGSLDELLQQEHRLTDEIAQATNAYVDVLAQVSATSAALVQAESRRREVNEELAGLTIDMTEPPTAAPVPLPDEAAIAEATDELRRAQIEAADARAHLEVAQTLARDNGEYDAMTDRARGALAARLERLQRATGSPLPLVLDNALAGFSGDQRTVLLGWLAAQSDLQQIVVLTDDRLYPAAAGLTADTVAVIDLR
ncbi:MAG: hypothetical protein AB7L13_23820 [Acidimicrobiia bacterium]